MSTVREDMVLARRWGIVQGGYWKYSPITFCASGGSIFPNRHDWRKRYRRRMTFFPHIISAAGDRIEGYCRVNGTRREGCQGEPVG